MRLSWLKVTWPEMNVHILNIIITDACSAEHYSVWGGGWENSPSTFCSQMKNCMNFYPHLQEVYPCHRLKLIIKEPYHIMHSPVCARATIYPHLSFRSNVCCSIIFIFVCCSYKVMYIVFIVYFTLQMAGMLRAGPLATKAMRVLEENDSCTRSDMSNFISAVAQVTI